MLTHHVAHPCCYGVDIQNSTRIVSADTIKKECNYKTLCKIVTLGGFLQIKWLNRKAKQRKTDRIDATKMVRALLAYDRGDAAVLSQVRVPSVEEEDRKRLLRERQRLVKERTSLTNAIKGLLKLHGVFSLEPRAADFDVAFAAVTTAYGEPLPTRARREIERLAERLGLVMRQVEAIEAERDTAVRAGAAVCRSAAAAGSAERADATIAALTGLRGIGANDATLHKLCFARVASTGATVQAGTEGTRQRPGGCPSRTVSRVGAATAGEAR